MENWVIFGLLTIAMIIIQKIVDKIKNKVLKFLLSFVNNFVTLCVVYYILYGLSHVLFFNKIFKIPEFIMVYLNKEPMMTAILFTTILRIISKPKLPQIQKNISCDSPHNDLQGQQELNDQITLLEKIVIAYLLVDMVLRIIKVILIHIPKNSQYVFNCIIIVILFSTGWFLIKFLCFQHKQKYRRMLIDKLEGSDINKLSVTDIIILQNVFTDIKGYRLAKFETENYDNKLKDMLQNKSNYTIEELIQQLNLIYSFHEKNMWF